MNTITGTPAAQPGIRPEEFDALRELVYQEIGVTLGDGKQAMLAARLAKRLRHLNLSNYGDYYRYVVEQGPRGSERQELINCVTTNKTDFFREAHHFDYLRDVIFPEIHQRAAQGGPRRMHIWSAGCSSGEEPYTLAIWILEHFGSLKGWDVKILATDIDTNVLQHAVRGIYEESHVSPVGQDLLRKYFLRGTGQKAGLVALRNEPRSLITFAQLNLMDQTWRLPWAGSFDVIFCRNVMIYFDRATQQHLVSRFAAQLNPNGHLILGHSENIHGPAVVFRPLGGTIYKLISDSEGVQPTAPVSPSTKIRELTPGPNSRAPSEGSLTSHATLPDRNLIVGDVVACEKPTLLKTLLGSCVSACLYDPVRGIGGMNHFSLPGTPGLSDDGTWTRYGVHAMEMLINEIMKLGGDRRRLRAKVFGGAKVLKIDSESLNIGQRNAQFVLDFLSVEGIEIVSQSLGGTSGLRVHFQPHTGKAFLKPLDGRVLADITSAERRYSQSIAQSMNRSDDNVTLF